MRRIVYLLFLPLFLMAATLRVNVLDGTSGEPGTAQRVAILDLGQGMTEIASQMSVTGSTTFEDLEVGDTPNLLIQAYVDGVIYSSRFPMGTMPRGTNWETSVTTYASTATVGALSAEVPFLFVTVLPEELYIQKRIVLDNQSDPPTTYNSPEGVIRVHLPTENVEIDFVTVKSGTMPLRVTPNLAEDGSYRIPKALKPGVTEIDLAYSVPYSSAGTDLEEISYYDTEHFHFFVSPSTIQVEADGLASQGVDEANNLGIYAISDVKAGQKIDFRISGLGMNPQMQENPHNQGGGQIIVQKRFDLNLEAIIVILALMIGLIGIAMVWNSESSTEDQADRRRRLKDRKKELLKEYEPLRNAKASSQREHTLNRLITIYKALETDQ